MTFLQYKSTGRQFVAGLLLSFAASSIVLAADNDAPAATTISIDNFSFSPDTLTITAGATVSWVNHDDIPHTVVSTDTPRLFKSPPLDTDGRFSWTFTTPGTYHYFCSIHPHMVGQVIVK